MAMKPYSGRGKSRSKSAPSTRKSSYGSMPAGRRKGGGKAKIVGSKKKK